MSITDVHTTLCHGQKLLKMLTERRNGSLIMDYGLVHTFIVKVSSCLKIAKKVLNLISLLFYTKDPDLPYLIPKNNHI